MEIVVDGDVQITPQELTAGLLWEITYYGGTEELVKDFHEGYRQVQAEKINLCAPHSESFAFLSGIVFIL